MFTGTNGKCRCDSKSVTDGDYQRDDISMSKWVITEYNLYRVSRYSTLYFYLQDKRREQSYSDHDLREQCNSISPNGFDGDVYIFACECTGCEQYGLCSITNGECSSDS